ncbi:invasion associated locus B family protein [Gymnodinialimonas ceratoperidinii]|uniref:Invasion associated locus B family protein n=1 Tax=Gymnodinialimonas ceratoperidinii TaxID=2856823 RepID=A0A8F6TT87_9RHOB|nr:invasion associated locus B family protein [Gymnodinialimonas ceratoperidinii]QXT38265.1 invasion associated locus B family protein [Gymnodinialimonas ceratoperidinii]
MTFLKPLAAGLLAALTLPGLALAQAEPLVLPDRSEVEAGEPYVAEIFRDWQVRCIRAETDEMPDRCEMFQLLEEENGNPVAEFRIAAALIDDGETVANATILTPLDTLLSPGLQIRVDDTEPAVVPFAFCRNIGCFVQLSLTAENVAQFENGADTQVVLFALVRDELGQMGGAPVPTTASLRGFTAAFDSLEERIVGVREFLAEQQAAAQQGAAEEGAEEAEGEGEAASE